MVMGGAQSLPEQEARGYVVLNALRGRGGNWWGKKTTGQRRIQGPFRGGPIMYRMSVWDTVHQSFKRSTIWEALLPRGVLHAQMK